MIIEARFRNILWAPAEPFPTRKSRKFWNVGVQGIPSPRIVVQKWTGRRYKFQKDVVVTQSGVYESQDVSDARAPPHHTESLPDTPGSPARLLSDVIISINVTIFLLQLVFPEITLAGIKVNEFIDHGEVSCSAFSPAPYRIFFSCMMLLLNICSS